ncbi:PREDICTED: putative uncharacterized protein FLJ44672, partial [Rhinopithecus bieti]|uniref:putative uncharacterized protein FLJ44672 n=1 Tax=Rhinopithecus bieti TaxID=61621 RepID=UPI00083BAA8F
QQPLQAPLLPLSTLSRPNSCLIVASVGQISACLPAASTGLAPPSQRLVYAQSMPLATYPGPAPASYWPSSFLSSSLQAQLLPVVGLYLTATLMPHGGLSRPAFAFWHPLQAQNFPQSASPGPALPPSNLCRPKSSQVGLFWPSSCLLVASEDPNHPPVGFSRPSSCLLAASPGAKLSPVRLSRPSSCLSVAFPGPAFDFWWPLQAQNLTSSQPLQAQLLPSEGLYRPNLCLTVDAPRPALASL